MRAEVQHAVSNGERYVWSVDSIEFHPRDHGRYAASLELGRAAYNKFHTTRIHAEGPIRNESGTVLFNAIPHVVREGADDAWLESR